MTRSQKKYLYDISESIKIIFEDHLEGIDSLATYEADVKTQDAVERRLMIVAEALLRLRREGVSLPYSDQIINRRNTMTHQYDDYRTERI